MKLYWYRTYDWFTFEVHPYYVMPGKKKSVFRKGYVIVRFCKLGLNIYFD